MQHQKKKGMEIKIRKAVKEDCARLLELVTELAVYEKAPQEVTVTLNHFEESGFGENPVWWAFVATSPNPSKGGAEEIAGFALYYIRYSTWKGQRMYLEDIVVLSLIHISEPTRRTPISYAVFCLKKKK